MNERELKQLYKLLGKFQVVENPTSEADIQGKKAPYNSALEKDLIHALRRQVKWYAEDEMGFNL